ncbi:hypothetical protein BCIN_02g08640 [Botrytis cinerea B05.10]|uniref:Duf167 domain protein n=2 Tax=Botryotinia fuckeliana TaxID=40559 RepID=A0A384JAX8_BOTFB|nr:hypothetical protein BCIN_02g08640 [Botrytis cinerea B05.10]ATZ47601.1 hypothetical protein BCIN_02g08640 [Botrytis cinerea B05.10]CCD50794.1 similar to yggU family protein [Botrytis cinerea T4]
MASIIPTMKCTAGGFLKIVKQTIHLSCHVKPNSSASRVGVKAFSDTSSSIEVCVAQPARDNEANKGVVEVLSHILKCPKTDLEVIRGKTSKNKIIAYKGIEDLLANDSLAELTLEGVRQRLQMASRTAEP